MEREGNMAARSKRPKDYLLRTAGKLLSHKTSYLVIFTTLALAGCSNEAPLSSATTAGQTAAVTSKPVKTAAVTTQAWAGAKTLTADVIPSLELNIVLKADGDVKSILKNVGNKSKRRCNHRAG